MGFCEATFMPNKDTAADSVQHQHALPYRQRSASKTVSKAHIRGDMTTIAAAYCVEIDYREAGSGQI
jgi:hypothetical protein